MIIICCALHRNITQRVVEAVSSVLGVAARAAHEALFVGVDLLQFVPIPALDVAGKAILNIWDAVDKVQVSSYRMRRASVC